LLAEIHESFKAMVRDRRASKLKAKEQDLFDGSFWTGRKALALGLIDAIGHREAVLRAKFGDKVEIDEMSPSKGFGARMLGLGSRHALATEFAEAAFAAVEERALWQRFGL
jgi:ClpP class serine protease